MKMELGISDLMKIAFATGNLEVGDYSHYQRQTSCNGGNYSTGWSLDRISGHWWELNSWTSCELVDDEEPEVVRIDTPEDIKGFAFPEDGPEEKSYVSFGPVITTRDDFTEEELQELRTWGDLEEDEEE